MINQNLLLTGDDGYNLTKSLRFRSSASAYLNRTPASNGNSQKITYSVWLKRGALGYSYATILSGGTNNVNTDSISFDSNDKLVLFFNGSSDAYLITSQVFRDPSAWYHIVLAVDTTQATAANRIKMYVNGSQITAFSTATYPTQNYNLIKLNNASYPQGIGTTGGGYFDGYLAEVNFIDGQALTPSSFGETSTTTGVWIPKKYTGTYGTNGFYLPFTDTTSTSTLGTDFSGNSNTWTVNNISLTSGSTYDSMNDVPTLTSATTANYATWNSLPVVGDTDKPTYSEGNLTVAFPNFGYAGPLSTISLPTQNTYCEITCASVGGGGYSGVGIAELFADLSGNVVPTKCVTYGPNGGKTVSGAFSSYGSSFTTGDIIGIAYDYSGNQVTFYKNNVSQGALSLSSLSGALFFCCHATSGAITWTANFGQRPFSYTPPTGFVALNTFNLPTPTIGATASSQAGKYFNPVLYTGDGVQDKTISGVGFQPDFVWIKNRGATSSHVLYNAITGGTKQLFSNLTNAEQTNNDITNGFSSDGFIVGDNVTGTGSTNENTNTYVAWNWKANGAGSTNTAGSITSTVSANTTAGFSIVTYTGNGTSSQTCGHGLGVTPSMVIWKNRNDVDAWIVYHNALTTSEYLVLNTTAAKATVSGLFTGISSTLLPLNNVSAAINANGFNYVAYCFAQVAGYSAFGSYTGNGSTDGPFIYTGFRPKFIMWKRTDASGGNGWYVLDTARSTYNVMGERLYPNLSAAGGVDTQVDYLSNGFKLRTTDTDSNASGGTYIYMAFAEFPQKFSLAR